MVKISTFMIGLVAVAMFGGLFGLALAEFSQEYGTPNYQNNLTAYNQLDNLTTQAEAIQDRAIEIKTKSGVLDIIGGYFQSAYDVLVLTKNSFTVFEALAFNSIESAGMGSASYYFRVGITTIVLILIFVGVLISAIIKKDL